MLKLWLVVGETGGTVAEACPGASCGEMAAGSACANLSTGVTRAKGVGASLRRLRPDPCWDALSAGCRGAWLAMRACAPAGTLSPPYETK